MLHEKSQRQTVSTLQLRTEKKPANGEAHNIQIDNCHKNREGSGRMWARGKESQTTAGSVGRANSCKECTRRTSHKKGQNHGIAVAHLLTYSETISIFTRRVFLGNHACKIGTRKTRGSRRGDRIVERRGGRGGIRQGDSLAFMDFMQHLPSIS